MFNCYGAQEADKFRLHLDLHFTKYQDKSYPEVYSMECMKTMFMVYVITVQLEI